LTVPVIVDAEIVIVPVVKMVQGATATISVTLTVAPTANVVVTAASTFANITLTTAIHTFTAANWAAGTVGFSTNAATACSGILVGDVTFTAVTTDFRYTAATWEPTTKLSKVTMICKSVKLIQFTIAASISATATT
jgi:hypothetical protein